MSMTDLFTEQVHEMVCRLADWMRAEAPDADRLMPALAVALGRVIANRAASQAEVVALLDMAANVTNSAAHEGWQTRWRQDVVQ